MRIEVNGVTISEREIAHEAQYHPAGSLDDARRAAAVALVVRELLMQEASRRGVAAEAEKEDGGENEVLEERVIRRLLASQLDTPEADEESCRHYYQSNRRRFRSPDLVEARHILFLAAPDDEEALEVARKRAEETIAELQRHPGRFADLARQRSDCPSAQQGGNLGQLTRGSTVAELETFMFNLEEGQLCPVAIKTRYGYHVLKVERRVDGQELPFEAVRQRIADYLEDRVWRQAVRQYISLLVGQARIEGIDLPGATSPLVQ